MYFKQLPPELNALISDYNRVKIPENVAECIQRNRKYTIYSSGKLYDYINYQRITKINNKYILIICNLIGINTVQDTISITIMKSNPNYNLEYYDRYVRK